MIPTLWVIATLTFFLMRAAPGGPFQSEREIPAAAKLIARWIADPQMPIDEVRFVRLSQSMVNGGGPACLRLRMMLESDDVRRLTAKFQLNVEMFDRLTAAIEKWYPQSLSAKDLYNAEFVAELNRIDEEMQAVA